MSNEKRPEELDSDALAILARRKKLLASAALSLAISCEVRQEPQAPNQQTPTAQTITLPQSEPEDTSASTPASTSVPASAPASTPSTAPIVKPPCLSRPPSICLKIAPPKKICLSKIKKAKICLTEL